MVTQDRCSNCGNILSPSDPVCTVCLKENGKSTGMERRTGLLIAGVIIFAVIGISALAAVTYMAISFNEDRPTDPGVATANPSPTPRNEPVSADKDVKPNIQAIAETDTKVSSEILTRYTESIEPLIEKTRAEMEGTLVDLKRFLKSANQTDNSRDTRRIIDDFRKRLEEREQRLDSVSNSLKAIAPPPQLQQQHYRLSTGVIKYAVAVQSYIRGLSAYSFNQIRASQSDLEAADREIKMAADDFQQTLAQLTITAQ
jgi:hypothetical protein